MTFPVRRLFLHFYDPHYMGRTHNAAIVAKERAEAETATRLALLCAEQVYVPAASYIENDACRAVINSYADIFDDGAIQLVGGEDTFEMYALSKLFQYDQGTTAYSAYETAASLADEAPGFVSRHRNTTSDLREAWSSGIGVAERMTADLSLTDAKGFVRRWGEVSDDLGNRAFIPDYVVPLLGIPEDSRALSLVRSRVRTFINKGYFGSFLREYDAGVITDLVYMDAFTPEPDVVRVPYKELRNALIRAGLMEGVLAAPAGELRRLHEDQGVAREVLRVIEAARAATLPNRLTLPIGNLAPDLARLLKVKRGRATAHTYAKRFKTVFEALCPYSLDEGKSEAPINEGRKRIDILFPNMAESGAFRWAASRYAARFVIVECKNYTEDLANPEYDQLGMRFNRERGMFGIIACRRVKDMETALKRCRDAHRDGHGLMVPLTDDDLKHMVGVGVDPGWAPLGDSLLGKRMLAVASG